MDEDTSVTKATKALVKEQNLDDVLLHGSLSKEEFCLRSILESFPQSTFYKDNSRVLSPNHFFRLDDEIQEQQDSVHNYNEHIFHPNDSPVSICYHKLIVSSEALPLLGIVSEFLDVPCKVYAYILDYISEVSPSFLDSNLYYNDESHISPMKVIHKIDIKKFL